MRMIRAALAAATLAATATCAVAQPVEAAGVRFDQSVQVGGKPLVLNGVGVRFRGIFKVAAIALYLAKKAETAEAALAQPGPKRIQMVMLRSVSPNDVGRVLSNGIEGNVTRQEFIAVLPGLARIGEVASQLKTMSHGDSIAIEWSPEGGGASFFVNGNRVAGPYGDYAAFTGFAKIWLGQNPMDKPLKEALLGRPSAAAGAVDVNPYHFR
ncbi:chalcone isomerase family protein [Ramlibacter henchirensis]|nr:chalcone isomerase family protein [Ramlibacter henchirensis]